MVNYFLNRWLVTRNFEKAEGGYVYRRRPDLPGIKLTDDERHEVMRDFRSRYWRSSVFVFFAFIGAAILVAAFSVAFDLSDLFLQVSAYALMTVLVGYILLEQRQWTRLPETRFADRPRLPPAEEPGGWLTRFHRLSRQRSWPKYALFLVIYLPISWLLFPRTDNAHWGHWFLFGSFALGLILIVYGMVYKALNDGE